MAIRRSSHESSCLLCAVLGAAIAGCGASTRTEEASPTARGRTDASVVSGAPERWRAFVALEGEAAVVVLDNGPGWRVVRRTGVSAGPHNLTVSPDG